MEKSNNQSNSASDAEEQKKGQSQDNQSGKSNDGQGGLNLTDEQWNQVFNHPRFKDLNKRAVDAEKALADKDAEEKKNQQKKLKEDGKLQELVDSLTKENEELKSSMRDLKLEGGIVTIASKLKVLDTDAVVKLLDRSKITLDKDGNPTNLEDVVSELLKEKPYLANETDNSSSNIGGNANTSTDNQNGNFVITRSELREKLKDHKWYEEHAEEIKQWQSEGRIDYSR